MNTLTLFQQRDSILAFAKDRLNDDQQKVFVEHFLMSLTAPDDPFPISAEKAMEWLGYERKDKFKNVITKHLKVDIEYKFSLLHPEEQTYRRRRGGHNYEDIRISIDGFKILEMVARTKQGDVIRSYYPQLEKIVYEYSIFQHQKALQEAQTQIQSARQEATNYKYALEAERENIARRLRRRVNTSDMKDVVYLYQEGPTIIKVGEACDLARRESEHRSSSYISRVVYAKQCTNRKLLEKVVHHILDEYRIDPQREWFNVSVEIAKEALDAAQLFLDGMVNRCATIHEHNLCSKMECLFNDVLAPKPAPPPDDPTTKDQGVEEEEHCEEEQSSTESVPIAQDTGDVVNPLNFDKFIEDCCELRDDNYTFSAELFGAHRMWSRCCLKTTVDALYKYLTTRFKTSKRYDVQTGATLAAYDGLVLKPYVAPCNNPPTDIDEFIDDCCVTNYTYRIQGKQLYKAYETWRKTKIAPSYQLNAQENKRLCKEFSKLFVPANVYVDGQSCRGYFGIDLKDSKNLNAGLKLTEKLKKKVLKIDIDTKQVVETYDSLGDAARAHNRCNGNMSSDIRYEKPWNGFLFKYASP